MQLKQRTDFTDEHVYQAYLQQQIAEAGLKQNSPTWQDFPSQTTLVLERQLIDFNSGVKKIVKEILDEVNLSNREKPDDILT